MKVPLTRKDGHRAKTEHYMKSEMLSLIAYPMQEILYLEQAALSLNHISFQALPNASSKSNA